MYAYVDESGNTGSKVFDPDQPLFITAAMMTKTNFDATHKAALSDIARKVGGKALHANELGVARIEDIADDLLRVVKRADARFFVARVEKRYLVAAKVFDTYFDAGENLAVPWQIYWARPLKLAYMFTLSRFVVTGEIERAVWECVTAPNERKSKEAFLRGAAAMLERAHLITDPRGHQVVVEALQWALENPENFSTYIRDRINRNAHAPNFVAFTLLMDGLDKASKAWRRPVLEIVHDQQSEFEKTLRQWHEVYSRPDLAKGEPRYWPGESEPISLSKTPGSKFRMAIEETSPGLQVIDVILWLFKRFLSGKEIGPRGGRLLNRVFHRGQESDFSFAGVEGFTERKLAEIMTMEMDEEQLARGADFTATEQSRRREALLKYAEEKARAEVPGA